MEQKIQKEKNQNLLSYFPAVTAFFSIVIEECGYGGVYLFVQIAID